MITLQSSNNSYVKTYPIFCLTTKPKSGGFFSQAKPYHILLTSLYGNLNVSLEEAGDNNRKGYSVGIGSSAIRVSITGTYGIKTATFEPQELNSSSWSKRIADLSSC